LAALPKKTYVEEGSRMRNRRAFTLVAGALAAFATAVGCRDTATPTSPSAEGLALEENYPPPDGELPNFRLTGGGRVDEPAIVPEGSESAPENSTPGSRDFATFGFQARPTGTGDEGSGNITWVDHNPDAPGGGFTFHGRVEHFAPIVGPEGDCATFRGTGRGRMRDGTPFDGVAFSVPEACDVREPGRGADHIEIVIEFEGGAYAGGGVLSGGNIQSHKL
jgi:hypothetical protein